MKELDELERISKSIAAQLEEFNRVCEALNWYPEEEPLHNGYTMARWRQMVEGPRNGIPFVCEFWDKTEDEIAKAQLGTVYESRGSMKFQTVNGGQYLNCRVITRPGFWVPWFWGEIPVHGTTTVFICRDGRPAYVNAAADVQWQPVVGDYDILAYMVAPEVGK